MIGGEKEYGLYQITAKTGSAKGTSWIVQASPLIFGRDITCAIKVSDPLVSRRHCAVSLEDDSIVLKDLGSSNATFVNGDPVKQAVLRAGDEIAVGSAIFLVTRVREFGVNTPLPPNSPPPTCSLIVGEPLYMTRDRVALVTQGRPRTGEDLADLFTLGRALSEASTMSGLITALIQRIIERFEPRAVCVAVSYPGDEGFVLYPRESDADFGAKYSVRATIKQIMTQQQGVLLPESIRSQGGAGIRTTAAAPMILGKDAIGALVVQTESPDRIYDETDLEFLLAQAQVAAPYLRALERVELLERENTLLVSGAAEGAAIIGESPEINRVRGLARDCARSDLNAVILGETGTGKELVVKLIHRLSARSEAPLTVVNCAAIPAELLESELFGYERGAFTGAHGLKRGVFEETDGGTLFLDELCDLSLPNQARLLRAIETGVFRRLGGQSDIKVNVRVIAATNKDIKEEVERGLFRRDLYHRLSMFEIRLPPLRERRSDIPLLAEHFHRSARERLGYRTAGFSQEALQFLDSLPWNGNVRELRNVIERAMVVAPFEAIRPEDLDRDGTSHSTSAELEPFLSLVEMEKRHVREALRRCDNNIKAAAELLDIGRSTLYRKVSDYNISL
jgi:Nif-specific regulatory protein